MSGKFFVEMNFMLVNWMVWYEVLEICLKGKKGFVWNWVIDWWLLIFFVVVEEEFVEDLDRLLFCK